MGGAVAALAPVFSAVSAIGSLLGGFGAAKGALQKAPAPTPIPEPKEPAVMPVPDDKAAMDARRKQIAAIQGRSGRESTFLSGIGQDDRLGAG